MHMDFFSCIWNVPARSTKTAHIVITIILNFSELQPFQHYLIQPKLWPILLLRVWQWNGIARFLPAEKLTKPALGINVDYVQMITCFGYVGGTRNRRKLNCTRSNAQYVNLWFFGERHSCLAPRIHRSCNNLTFAHGLLNTFVFGWIYTEWQKIWRLLGLYVPPWS